jgi:L,D-transpeptidase catalytic domain
VVPLARGIGCALTGLILAALLVAGCGSDSENPPAQTISVTVRSPDAATTTAAAVEPSTDPDAVEAAPSAEPPVPASEPSLARPPGAYAAVWVRAGERVEMRTEPGGGKVIARVGRRTDFGSPSVFGVVQRRGDWVGVSTERLPNGRLGWIRLDPDRVDGGWTRDSVVIDLSAYRAELRRGDRVVASFAVTIGAPGSPTPTGRFAVTDTFTDLDSDAYGCCALALSATQASLPSGWLGGNRIAIHGTSGPLGIAASHGCVRAADDEVRRLVRTVPLGTPVFIKS